MNNFDFKNPTKIIFGKDSIEKIESEIPKDAKVLLEELSFPFKK